MKNIGYFDENINHFGPMEFEANQEQNESYNFKDMLLQPDKSDFIIPWLNRLNYMKP